MPRAIVVANERADHQMSWGRAFAAGLVRHGWEARVQRAPDKCDLLVLWGTRKRFAIDAQNRSGGEVVVLERGYVGDRFEWTSVSFGGQLNGRATFRGPFYDGSRWERYHARLLKPWRQRDGYALLIGQVPGDMSITAVDIDTWYRRTSAELRSAGWDVRFRPHPVAVQRGYASEVRGVPTIGGDLASALDGAGVVVTFNSNTGVESVLAGVSSIAMDEGSMAWEVTGHTPEEIVTPNRTAWAYALAWKQWRMEEMSSGACWEAIGICYARTS